jgi:hypothetical protein
MAKQLIFQNEVHYHLRAFACNPGTVGTAIVANVRRRPQVENNCRIGDNVMTEQ